MPQRILAIFALLLLLTMPAPSRAGDAAMVVDLNGSAKFDSGSRVGQELNLMDFLAEGDRLVLGSDCRLVLNYFASGQREALNGPGSLAVGARASVPGAGLKMESSSAVAPPPTAMVDSGAQHAGTVTLRGGPLASGAPTPSAGNPLTKRRDSFVAQCTGPGRVTPLNMFQTAVADPRPTWRWKAVSGAQAYALKVVDGQGRTVLERVVDGTTLTHPGPDLAVGTRYAWTVTALTGRQELGRGGGEFRTLTPAQLQEKVEGETRLKERHGLNSNEGRVGLAMLYQKLELYDDAATGLQALLVDHPGNQGLARQLTLLDPTQGR